MLVGKAYCFKIQISKIEVRTCYNMWGGKTFSSVHPGSVDGHIFVRQEPTLERILFSNVFKRHLFNVVSKSGAKLAPRLKPSRKVQPVSPANNRKCCVGKKVNASGDFFNEMFYQKPFLDIMGMHWIFISYLPQGWAGNMYSRVRKTRGGKMVSRANSWICGAETVFRSQGCKT